MGESEQCEKTSREEWWSEIDANEKANRLRKEVKRMRRQMKEVVADIRRLRRHRHNLVTEELMYFLSDSGGPVDYRDKDGDDVYF